MKENRFAICPMVVAVVFACLAFVQAETKTLKVKVEYTGEEKVDSSHRIHLYLFDTPNVSSGSMPIAWNSASKNGEEVEFSGISASPVYLVAAFGSYDPTAGPPPSGTPVSFYQPGQMQPTPIELEEPSTAVEMKFDDTVRMP